MTLGHAPPPVAPQSAQRGVMAAIACIALFGVALSITHPLISLRLEMAGWAGMMIGVSASAAPLAQLALTPWLPKAIRRLGLPGFLMLGAIATAVTVLLFPLHEDYWLWLGLRLLLGAAAAMLFLGSEAWITAAADPASRGRVLGFYATVLSLGFVLGPLILTETGVEGWTPFVLVAAISLICIGPLLGAWRDAPTPHPDDESAVPPLRFFRSDPTPIWAVALFGAIEFGLLGLMPVWGVRGGLETDAAASLLSAMLMGGVAMQIPLGALADRFDRRALMIACAVGTLIGALSLPFLAGEKYALWALLFLLGGVSGGLYTIPLVELGARYHGAALVSANASVIIAYGFGALIAPVLFGAAMDVFDPHGLPLAAALLAASYLALALWRGLTSTRARL